MKLGTNFIKIPLRLCLVKLFAAISNKAESFIADYILFLSERRNRIILEAFRFTRLSRATRTHVGAQMSFNYYNL
jgi:hypothetical protein